jgi:signal transduction histidine kinase
MSNLISNAIKFSPHGKHIIIAIDDEKIARGHRQTDIKFIDAIHLTVRDQGPGIPDGELEAIFDKFIQSQHCSSDAGTGLGLAICKEIVENHFGTIIAENAPDGGAIFSIVLPKKPPFKH